jgi:hypothetical protein
MVLVLAAVATAGAFPGAGGGFGGGGFGGGGFSGVSPGAVGLTGAGVPGMGGPGGLGPTFSMPQRFRDMNVTGKVGVRPGSTPLHTTLVRLSLDGQEIPMRLDTETQSAELQFNPDDAYARDLYQSILTKRVEVMGSPELRDQIAQAAAESKPVEIEGYVFDRTSPYFVVKSVKAE